MNITKDSVDELNAVVTIKIEKSDYEERVENLLKDYRRKARFDGFRPGKVPQGLVNKMYRKPVLVEEINKILGESLSKFLVDEKLNILGEPLPNEEKPIQINWDQDSEFEFSFDIAMAPSLEFTVSDKDIIPYYVFKIVEDDIAKQRDKIIARFGTFRDVEEVQDNDLIKADLAESNETGELAENGIHVENVSISLDSIKDPEIKNKFQNVRPGDVIITDVKKTFENETDLAAMLKINKEKLAETGNYFRITVNSISRFEKPELNQELFDKIYGPDTIKSLEEFNARIEEELRIAFSRSSDYKFRRDAREYFLNNFTRDLPTGFLKRWLLHTNNGKLTPEQIEQDFDHFVQDLKWQLIKGKIAKDNEMKIVEAELVAHVMDVFRQQFVQYYGIADVPVETLEKYAKESLSREEERNRYIESLMENKVFEFMQKTVKLNTNEVTLDEFNKMFNK